MEEMDMTSFSISENHYGWFIHAFKKRGRRGRWLSSTRDKWISSEGGRVPSWEGYYGTKQEAVNRLKEYRMKYTKQIRIGGE